MQTHELFQHMSEDTASSVFGYFREEERDAYRGAIATLAGQRKLRPVFVTKKSVPDQFAWLKKSCARKQAADAGEHLLQIWLLRARSELLVQFLDGVGIEHDGSGAVDNLPESLDAEKLKSTVDGLVEKYPAEEVAIYLHVFQAQTPDGWPQLAELLEQDERLALANKA